MRKCIATLNILSFIIFNVYTSLRKNKRKEWYETEELKDNFDRKHKILCNRRVASLFEN